MKLQKSTQPSSISKFQQFLNEKISEIVEKTRDKSIWFNSIVIAWLFKFAWTTLAINSCCIFAWITLDMKSYHFSKFLLRIFSAELSLYFYFLESWVDSQKLKRAFLVNKSLNSISVHRHNDFLVNHTPSYYSMRKTKWDLRLIILIITRIYWDKLMGSWSLWTDGLVRVDRVVLGLSGLYRILFWI